MGEDNGSPPPRRDPPDSECGHRRTGSRAVKSILGLAGLALLAYLIHRAGFQVILTHIREFGWNFILVFALGGLWLFLQTLAWQAIQSSRFPTPALFTLFRYKIICDGFNTILPLANLGGEATRVYLIQNHTPLGKGLAGVMVDKTMELLAGVVFMASGLMVGFLFSQIPRALILPGLLCLAIIAVGIIFLIVVLHVGFFDLLLKMSGLIGVLNRLVRSREASIRRLEEHLRTLVKQPPGRIILAGLFHLLSRLLGVVEAWIVLRILDVSITFADTLVLMALVVGINTLFFLIPGQWGISEGSHMVILQSLGVAGPFGLSLGIIKRIRKIFFAGLGLLLFQLEKWEPVGQVPEEEE
jgi:hypothetical protein